MKFREMTSIGLKSKRGGTMEEKTFQRSAYVLGKEHTLNILKTVHSKGWTKASDVADHLDLHIATCSQYLKELWELDILEERKVQAKTREVIEYRVKDPKIELNYDLSAASRSSEEDIGPYRPLFDSLLKRTKNMYGFSPLQDESIDIDSLSKKEILSLSREILEYSEEKIGLHSTQKLVKRVGKDLQNRNTKKGRGYDYFDALPSRYTDLLELGGNQNG